MKMAENPIMLSFQNNCESINSNCVEVVHDQNTEKIINGDITTTTTTTTTTTEINNSEDNPNMEKPEDSTLIIEKSPIPDDDNNGGSNNNNNNDNDNGDNDNDNDNNNDNKTESTSSIIITTQEGTSISDDFLAGDSKTTQLHHNSDDVDDDDDDLLLANIETDNDDGIVFKTDNVIIDCTEIEEKNEFNDDDDGGGIVCEDDNDDNGDIEEDKVVEETFDICTEEDECNNLTKMQIMEEVHEGNSSIQPSSPGHAEERSSTKDVQPIKSEETEENGFDDENCVNGDETVEESKPIVNDEIKEEKSESEIVIKSENTSNSAINEDNSNTNSSEESQTNNNNTNTNNNNNNNNNKRKSDTNESPTKRLRLEIQENFINRDKILNEFIELADCNNVEQIQLQTEQILTEIRTLNDMAKEKEREWNNIIHLKKMKEELLLRIQRRKQVILLTNDKSDNNDNNYESQNQEILKNNHQSILKANLTNQKRVEQRTSKNRSILPKPSQQFTQIELNGDYKQQQQQSKNRPVLDVQSIIADYRQRHPETVPRRGRRIRSAQTDNKSSSNIINFSSLTLGSGSQVHHNVQGMDSNNDIGILLNAIDTNRNENSQASSSETSQNNELSFKDMLIQFAKLSQSERNELIQNAIKPPPPYPEVTVHPVPTTTVAPVSNSLLHGILTKTTSSKANTKTSFSPTLARLLTAPERGNGHAPVPNLPNNLLPHQSTANMSISEILSTSKARNEITITPVGAQYDNLIKNKNHLEEDEAEDSADRLVIDESNENDNRSRGGNVGDNNSDVGDEVPQCQGCNQKSALFVCAGCGNQWYCSRDCQVSAWDEHSEVCSG